MDHDLLNILMIFGIKEKSIILTHTVFCWLIATNIALQLKTGFVVQGHIWLAVDKRRRFLAETPHAKVQKMFLEITEVICPLLDIPVLALFAWNLRHCFKKLLTSPETLVSPNSNHNRALFCQARQVSECAESFIFSVIMHVFDACVCVCLVQFWGRSGVQWEVHSCLCPRSFSSSGSCVRKIWWVLIVMIINMYLTMATYNTFLKFGVKFFWEKKLILLFSKDSLNYGSPEPQRIFIYFFNL